jgi:hypothetical protein
MLGFIILTLEETSAEKHKNFNVTKTLQNRLVA